MDAEMDRDAAQEQIDAAMDAEVAERARQDRRVDDEFCGRLYRCHQRAHRRAAAPHVRPKADAQH